jgi:arylsulfatase A-like enzyme
LYFPLTAPHKPVLPHPRFRGKTKLGPYGDFIVQVDWTVGQVMKAIDANKITDNTLLIYSSDNGSFMHRLAGNAKDHVDDETVQAYRDEHHTANAIYRGTKADIWEAGHRVPFFARWPNQIKSGTRCAETICLTDLFATTGQIVDAKLPKGAAADSYSFLPLLKGKPRVTPRPPVIHHSSGGMFAIRDGKWKLVLGNGSGGRQQPRGRPFARPYHLFDMTIDASERNNVIKQHPDVARRLEKMALEIRDHEHR